MTREDKHILFLDELIIFKNINGHCNVPSSYKDKWLVNKISQIKQQYKKGILSENLIQQLEDIGFIWNIYDEIWKRFINLITKYKAEHNDCKVPQGYKDKWLARRVRAVRTKYKNDTLSKERIQQLNKLGFVWNIHDDNWKRKNNISAN